MTQQTKRPDRPLSPHLQVYKLPLTAIMSISHRATGAALAIGTLLVTAFFIAAAAGPEYYDAAMGLATSIFGKIILVLWSFALFFHMCNGVRHMFWDIGKNFSKASAHRSNYYVIAMAVVLTALTWFLSCGCMVVTY